MSRAARTLPAAAALAVLVLTAALPATAAPAATGRAFTAATHLYSPNHLASFNTSRAYRKSGRLLVPVQLVDAENGRPVPGALLTVTVVPDHGRRVALPRARTDRHGRATVNLPGRFTGRLLLAWAGDKTHYPAQATLTERAPRPGTLAPPTSVTFGRAVSCVLTPDRTDRTLTYTVVFHGGRYTDLGGYGTHTATQVPGGDHEVTVVESPGGFGGNSASPSGTVTTFEPHYSEGIGLYGAPNDFAHSTVLQGSLPWEQVTCY